MKIEAGKYYRTREGLKVGPMESWCGYFSAKLGGPDLLWWPDGKRGSAAVGNIPEQDLIAEWTGEPAQPETGTLAELNLKPGDVVQEDNHAHQVVVAINMNEEEPFTLKNLKTGETDTFIGWYNRWRIVSRASQSTTPLSHSTTPPSPVRTVTRKEIVPGVYGKVSVHQLRPDNGGYYIAMVDSLTHKESTVHSTMTEADLTAAIQTLTEIRDALSA